MDAIDTSVVVRLLTADDKAQHRRAVKLLRAREVFVPLTVLLETEWVLRFTYDLDFAAVNEGLSRFCAVRTVSVEAPAVARQALDWHRAGMDFADALHRAASQHCGSFYSFDKKLARLCRRLEGVGVEAP